MKSRKTWIAAGILLLTAMLVFLGGRLLSDRLTGGSSRNLALQKGVKARCDSTENEELTADKVIDGDDQNRSSRWSSENNWDNAQHYIELEFPEEISVSFVVLKWERRNAVHYALEGSADGKEYEVLQEFMTVPSEKKQEIPLEDSHRLRFLRLSVYEVSQKEEDYSNLYQNVSLYEIEVYEDKPAAYLLEAPEVETAEDGSRYLATPKAPEGCEVRFIGADYEQIIGADGTVYDTIQEKEVTVGFLVTDAAQGEERERSFTIAVPASHREKNEANEKPSVTPALAEWAGGSGTFALGQESRILLAVPETDEQAAWRVAELLADELGECCDLHPAILPGTAEDAKAGDVVLGLTDEGSGLGEEGYTMENGDTCVIKAETITGLRWGSVTLQQLHDTYGDSIPQGEIRDYPLYAVRGFGIDVARKAVSMDTLTAMLKEMSYYKMNDLGLHLNDNVILATSGLDGSVEEALTAKSAFRLESDVANAEGKRLTSEEYAYTREELNTFIETAALYGVQVVPEIDTPAHSLAITSLYPEYALGNNPLWADQINLENTEATALVRKIWEEALDTGNGAFRSAGTVNIGMDEYYGDGEKYRQYLEEIDQLVQGYGKVVRLWGSLGNIDGTKTPSTDGLQMNIWSTVWADPVEMYHQGYSVINMQNNHLYIIPGGGYDYLDTKELSENWEPNRFYDHDISETVPAYSPQMLGAAYMIWNDMSGRLDLGISEADLYDRFAQPLAVLAEKLWGEQAKEAAQPTGHGHSAGYVDPQKGIAPSYEIECRVFLEKEVQEGAEGQVLSRSDSAYGEWAFYAAEPESGKVGFAREGKTYTFDYMLPVQQWVTLKIVGEIGMTTLYVDGEKVGTLGSREPFEEYATLVFPIQYLDRETGRFDGQAEWTALGKQGE